MTKPGVELEDSKNTVKCSGDFGDLSFCVNELELCIVSGTGMVRRKEGSDNDDLRHFRKSS